MIRTLLALSITASVVAHAADARAPAAGPQKVKLLVYRLTPAGGVTQEVAGALTDAVTTEISKRGLFEPLSQRDVEAIVGAERQRQLMGCSESGTSCLSELAGALGARFVLNGTLAKLGSAYQLTLQTLDTTKAQPIGRATRIADDLSVLRAGLPWAVAEATATPMPEPPSRVLPYSLLTGGGVAFLGGALATFDSLTRESALQRQLSLGDPAQLQPLSYYRQQSGEIALERGLGVGVIAAGLVLAGLGLWTMPPAVPGAVALVPTSRGAALVGVLP